MKCLDLPRTTCLTILVRKVSESQCQPTTYAERIDALERIRLHFQLLQDSNHGKSKETELHENSFYYQPQKAE